MKINAIKINNFIGIQEFEYKPGMVTILEGPKGSGKSSVLEAVETAATNNKRRTEVIRHNESESVLFLQMDNGLEVDRKLRNDKADYLKLRKEGEGIKSTETELRKFISGEIFRPLDFINMKASEQTQIILSMIEMNYGPEDFIKWFKEYDGILTNINTDKHVLQILADIESKLYIERAEINKTVSLLEAQAKGIENSLPDNYDGNVWRSRSLQEAYNKVNDAKKVNAYIKEAKELKENLQSFLNSIDFEKQKEIDTISAKYNELGTDIKQNIKNIDDHIEASRKNVSYLEIDLNNSLIQHDEQLKKDIEDLKKRNEERKSLEKAEFETNKTKLNDSISEAKSAKQQQENELASLEEKKGLEIKGINNQFIEKIETVKARAGKAGEYLLDHEAIDTDPLQEEADNLANMKEYLAEWDRMIEIRNGQIATKKAYSEKLTTLIETARNKPNELLKQHELPIEGIGVDANGMIRINGTLLDGLSDGEKLEAAFKIALQRIGELRILCLDGLEKLNQSEQLKVLKICSDNDVQVFVTITTDTESGDFIIKGEL